MLHISARELHDWLLDEKRSPPVLIDVRENWELQVCALKGVVHIPMNTIPARQNELEPEAATVVICHHGRRSMQVAAFLEQQGFSGIYNLSGGVDAWAREVDPAMPTY